MQKQSESLLRVSRNGETVLPESVSYIAETLSLKDITKKAKRSPKWWGKMPASILLDPQVDDLGVRIFGILGLKTYQGNVSYIGMRLLAELCGSSAATVCRRVQILEDRGHITTVKDGNGRRHWYVLNSPAFGQLQRDQKETIVFGRGGTRRMVSVEMEKMSQSTRMSKRQEKLLALPGPADGLRAAEVA